MPRKPKGIRKKRGKWQVYVTVRDQFISETFPLSTPLEKMRVWRDDQRIAHGLRPMPRGRCTKVHTYGPPKSHIYFIQCGEQVKVGVSHNPQIRLKHLQAHSPFPLTLIGSILAEEYLEATIHRRFAHCRLHHEWFRLEPDLRAFIQALDDGADLMALLRDGSIEGTIAS